MDNLHNLLEKFGHPDALIDHWDLTSHRFAIWGFSEQFVIDTNGTAIINGNVSDSPPLEIWQNDRCGGRRLEFTPFFCIQLLI